MKTVIIGGHLSPAISLIDEIIDSPRGEAGKKDVLFIGRKYALEGDNTLSLEYKICQEKRIEFAGITAGRIQRSFTRFTVFSALKIPLGIYQSFKILRRFKPDVVVGFGGYVSFPVVISAFLQRIPIVIHEQTLEAGFANKIEGFLADKVCISFEKSRNFFPKNKTVITGNPIRPEIISPKSNIELPSENIPLLYITGGSLGSVFINNLVEKSLKDLLTQYRIVHQAGSANNSESLKRLKEAKKTLNNEMRKRYIISDHYSADDVGEILRKASLVISRAGINTITELLYLNKPALLIPLSISQRNEQLKNAIFLKEVGLAQILFEKGLSNYDFTGAISSMIENINLYKTNENKEYLKENASQNILRVVENASKKTDQKGNQAN